MAGDIYNKYGTTTDFTISLASLASSSTLVVGRESAAVNFSALSCEDILVSGWIKAGTTLTAGLLQVWAYGQIDDTPTYPDVLDGTDSAQTFTSVDTRNASMELGRSIVTSTSNGYVYPVRQFSLRRLYGEIPKRGGIFVTHSMVGALDSTAGNHKLVYTPVYRQYT